MSPLKRGWEFKKGQRGPAISYLQEKLIELGFEPGAPDGIFDSRTSKAVEEFQRKNNLRPTGNLDEATIGLLYELTRGSDYPRGLVSALSAGAGEASAFTVRKEPPKDGRVIVISPPERSLGLFEGGRLIRKYPVAVGKPETPTPLGTFRILEKVMNPGGVLGTRWMAFTYEMHGIHGTNHPELIGQAVSHGCVRMYNENVEELYGMVDIGTPVIVISRPVEEWSGASTDTAGGAKPDSHGTSGNQNPTPPRPEPKDPNIKPGADSPDSDARKTAGAVDGTYTVQPGDSLWKIAMRFGTTVEALVRLNDIANPDLIYPGQVLRIK